LNVLSDTPRNSAALGSEIMRDRSMLGERWIGVLARDGIAVHQNASVTPTMRTMAGEVITFNRVN